MALALGSDRPDDRPDYGVPPNDRMVHGSRAIFFSDFLGDVEAMKPALAHAADQGVRGCFVQVLDESEEVFPFDGRMIFESMGGTTEFETQRARALREAYATRLAERRAKIARLRPPPRLALPVPPYQPCRRDRPCSGSTWRWANGRDSMIGPVAFLAPWLLLALATLPVLWWLLRAVPPAPGRRPFPGVRLLLGLTDPEKMPERTPWWLLLLGCARSAAAILAFAGPVLNPRPEGSGDPLLVLLDGGWGDAPDWTRRMDRAAAALDEASRDGRPAAVMAMTTPPLPGEAIAVARRRGLERAAARPRAALLGARPRRLGGVDRRAGRAVRDAVADRRHRARRRGRPGPRAARPRVR